MQEINDKDLNHATGGKEEFDYIKNGESLEQFAIRWGTTVEEIFRLNNIKDPSKIVHHQSFRVK